MVVFNWGKKVLRTLFPQDLINILWHLPNAIVAAVWYGFPGRRLTLIGVTGTDGKTTTVNLIYQILSKAGSRTSMISSVNAVIGNKTHDIGFHVTSPNPWDVQRYLARAVSAGSEYMVLEVTSHALDQYRFWGCPFKVGVLTNITHEHLDYHGSYEAYVAVKLKLLHMVTKAIVNKEDHSYQLLDGAIHAKELSFGLKKGDITPKTFPFKISLPGQYNQYNALAAIGATSYLGLSDSVIRQTLKEFRGVRGRFEIIYQKDITVIIDFAHTPNAFEQVLGAVRPIVQGRLIHVFGCAGLRDQTKRPIMGQISGNYADMIVLTEEDYRTESLEDIMNQIEKGITYKKKVTRIPNRQDAIAYAIANRAQKGDVVLLTGKAHERSLCRGTIEYPWNEYEAVKKALTLREWNSFPHRENRDENILGQRYEQQ